MRDGDDLRLLVEQPVELIHEELAVVVDGDHAQDRAGGVAEHLPRHDVGVVLHVGDENLVARPERRAAEAVGDEVDGLRRAAGEDGLAAHERAEEDVDLVAGLLVEVRGALAQVVDAAVDVRVVLAVEAR